MHESTINKITAIFTMSFNYIACKIATNILHVFDIMPALMVTVRITRIIF